MHRGRLLGRIVRSSDMPIKMIMGLMHLSRTTYYNHLKNKDLPLDILNQYGRVIGYDFSQDLPEMLDVEKIQSAEPLTLEEAILQRNSWRDRYYEKLEEYHAYLDSRVSVKFRESK